MFSILKYEVKDSICSDLKLYITWKRQSLYSSKLNIYFILNFIANLNNKLIILKKFSSTDVSWLRCMLFYAQAFNNFQLNKQLCLYHIKYILRFYISEPMNYIFCYAILKLKSHFIVWHGALFRAPTALHPNAPLLCSRKGIRK